MNYLLVKKEDVSNNFSYAKQIGDYIILPETYKKVLNGVVIKEISHSEAIELINEDKK